MNGNAYEYNHPIDLDGDSSAYFIVPASIIFDKEVDERRLTAFSYFSVGRGIDRRLRFSINEMVRWSGRTPNRNSNGINRKMSIAVQHLIDDGYLDVSGDYNGTHMADAHFNLSKVMLDSEHDRFAIIYVDEIRRIFEYDGFNPNDRMMNNDVLLLVFAYLRMMIYRRPNRLRPEERNVDDEKDHRRDIEARRIRSPEAYNGYYCDMADDIGLSSRVVSKAIDVLVDIGLIYTEALPRVKIGDRWVTTHTIFCNAYKREGHTLLDSGREYYLREIRNKKLKLDAMAKRQGG